MALRGELGAPVAGDAVKVHLPGESPWAECVAVHDDGTWEGRIANHLVGQMSESERAEVGQQFFPDAPAQPLPSLHDFKFDQIIRFKRYADLDYEIWVPAETTRGSA